MTGIVDDYPQVAVLENEVEAQLLDAILNERDIPHAIRSYYDAAYNGLFQTQKGWGAISVPAESRDEVLAILEDLRSGAVEQDGDDTNS